MRAKSGLITLTLMLLFMLFSLSLATTSAAAPATRSSASVMTDTGELIICFKSDATLALQHALATKYGYTLLERNDALNCILVQPRTAEMTQAKTAVSSEELVRYIESNKRVRALYTPNDLYFTYQWALPSIKVDRAWDRERGSKTVTIAIIDSGINYTHEDLSANYLPGGYDWMNNDTDPMDDFGHGTQCAGIAAALIDNGKGIAGIAQVQVMAEKVLDNIGWGTEWDVAQAVVHAADHNATIISLSLGGDEYDQMEEDACRYAWDNGCLLVAAAGNAQQYGVLYPAAYDSVIAVGSVDQTDLRRGNWGPQLELVAPGVSILSTTLNGGYASVSGTSMATPHVAGVAALIWSNYPSLTNQEVRAVLTQTATDLGSDGFDEYYGYGKIDALHATELHAFDTEPSLSPYPSISGTHNGTITPDATIIVSTVYTYPCAGTGGHSEYVRIWNATMNISATAVWNGYSGDWHNLSFNTSIVLGAGITYNFSIITGSYPQVHHTQALHTTTGWMNCTEFIDVNGKKHPRGIPGIRLFR